MKILIVDDEPGLAAGLAAWLTENGWPAPGVAVNGDEAVAWINENHGVDVLVTDVVMEPTDGFTLRDTVQPHFPKMKTIFISGYDLSDYAPRMENDSFLPKPVSGDSLDLAIRKLFETPAQEPVASPVAPATPRAVASSPQVSTPFAPRAVAAKVAAHPAEVSHPSAPRAVAATPKAAVPKAATPQAVAPQAVAGPVVAKVAATPRPSTPQAAPRPAAVQVRPAGPASASIDPRDIEVELPPDDYVGRMVGEYQIEAKIGESSQGGIYRALQTSIGRIVRLYLLDQARAAQPEAVERFIANASVKANVSHPYIFAVYEAGESGGVYFYSCEYVPCRSLRQLREAGGVLDETTAANVMRATAEVLGYFYQKNISHNCIMDISVLLAAKNKPRVANIAAHEASTTFNQVQEMTALASIIHSVLGAGESPLKSLTASLMNGTQQFASWNALANAVGECIPKIAPEDAYKLDAQERAAIRMVEEAKKKQRRAMLTASIVSLTLVIVLLGIVYWILMMSGLVFNNKTGKDFSTKITIPAGEFIYQDGQKVNLPAFDIDQYEVTIAQYAKFLDYLKAHPAEAAKFDSPDQPKGKSHVPTGWADENLATGAMPGYYTRAVRWHKFHDAALTVDSPVFGVDWYDAYAYARWKGRKLPSEQQWEKAARGTEGYKYPWGNQNDERNVNSGNDRNPAPDKGGEKDGYDAWSPVDGVRGDKSPFGVRDMAGNVSEWTDTFDTDPMLSSQKVPVIRGGNWRTPNDYAVTRRVLKLSADQTDEALGFRTVSDPNAPASAPSPAK